MPMIHRSISQDCFANKLSDMERCVSEIKVWMKCNMLKLNDDKTEFIVFKSKHNANAFAASSKLCSSFDNAFWQK